MKPKPTKAGPTPARQPLSPRRAFLAMVGGTALGATAGVVGLRGAGRFVRRGLMSSRWFLRRLKGIPAPTFAMMPCGIVVHHSATLPANQATETAASIDRDHRGRGLGVLYQGQVYNLAYHYVIRADGMVEPGRPERCLGGHTRSRKHNHWIGICLVGYFDPGWEDARDRAPTAAQMTALVRLSADVMSRYGLDERKVLPHRAINDTECPGKSFPWEEYLLKLREQRAVRVAANLEAPASAPTETPAAPAAAPGGKGTAR